ncbi:MAG TPA: methyltransferase regulatory domain-containing protein [Usitatibacter sp.]|nr:methyltransferase regulatory domain-containing protein [Usitatibacter sp.]
MTAYDEVPYAGRPYADAHPERMATMAALHGIEAAPVGSSRTLEIACGDGANLVPMAAELPGSTFFGFDLAAQPIEAGRRLAERAGLANVTLRQLDLADFPADAGEYDYIIAHGLYAWIPAPLRDRLLALIARHLAPRGVAFVSYNVFPGCHVRRMVWEMMRFHIEPLEEPAQRIGEARALARLLAEGRTRDDPFSALLKAELERFSSRDPGFLFHDDLAAINDPCWFHEFVAHADRHGLQFLCEAELVATSYFGLGEAARKVLDQLDPVVREQYLDFAKCRRFRQTLLCRDGLAVDRSSGVGRIESFKLASRARGIAGEPEAAAPPRSDEATARALLDAIDAASPNAVSVEDLAARMPGVERTRLRELCFAAAVAGAAQLHIDAPRLGRTLAGRPMTTSLARIQAADATMVTTLRHTAVNLDDELARRILALLDGTRDAGAIASQLRQPRDIVDARLAHLGRLGLVA